MVEKPSSAFTAAWLGSRAFAGWMLSVPSVEPAKYRSVGYGNTPAAGWNSAVLEVGCSGGVEPPGLPLSTVRSGAPMAAGGRPNPQPPMRNPRPARTLAVMPFFSVLPFLPPVLLSAPGRGKLEYASGENSGKVRRRKDASALKVISRKSARRAGAAPRRAARARVLRIIGGTWRGRKLRFPAAAAIRPTPDRVRETLFNWLRRARSRARAASICSPAAARSGSRRCRAAPRTLASSSRTRRRRARCASGSPSGRRRRCRGGARGRAALPGAPPRSLRHRVPGSAVRGATARRARQRCWRSAPGCAPVP